MRTLVVRNGTDAKLSSHTFQQVYTEMLLQITRDYPGLPDARTLRPHEIRFFYSGLREELKEHTKPK